MSGVPVKMKALVAYTQTDYRYIEDYPASVCGDDDIIIKTEACGVFAEKTTVDWSIIGDGKELDVLAPIFRPTAIPM